MSKPSAFPTQITGAAVQGTIRPNANKNPGPDPKPTKKIIRAKMPERKTANAKPVRGAETTRLMRRAEMLATYSSVLGGDAIARDIHDAMVELKGESAEVSADVLIAGLKSAGLTAEAIKTREPKADIWPAIAMMINGQAVLVLKQTADTLVLYEAGANGGNSEVPIEDFAPYFAGLLIRADTTLAKLDERHTVAGKAPHWFWGEITKYKRQFGDVALGSFVANMLAVSVALFSLQVYDRVIPHQSTATLWMLAIGALAAILLEALIKTARARLMDGAGKTIELNVQRLLMRKVLGMRSDKRPTSPSELFSAMREFSSVREFFTASSVGALTDIPFIFLFLFLVGSIAGNVVWVLIAGGIIMVLPGYFLQKRMVELSRQTQGASAKTSRLLHEAVFEHDTIKSARGEDRFMRVWGELTMLSALKSSEQRRMASVLTFWAQAVQQVTYVSAVIVGTYLVFAGDFTVGTIIAVGILSGRTLAPLTQLTGTMARWSNVKNALDGLEAIAHSEQDDSEHRTLLRRDRLNGAFELRNVTFAYDEDSAKIDVQGMRTKPGQRIAVLGANGSGKSTFLKLLSGLYAPNEGRVMIDDVDIGQIAPRDLRRNIGYLGQEVRLFAGTLRENLNLTLLERDDDRLLEALDFAGIGEFVRSHAKGLDLDIRDAGEGLSTGQRQSIGWARIWLQDPSVVLLDEPTAALDTTLEAQLVAKLDTWLDGRTALIATHRLPIVALTERTLIFQNGRLAIDGPRDEVLEHLKKSQGKTPAKAAEKPAPKPQIVPKQEAS
ncbi:MAG: ATP-binding cassette domain-containing protein [Maritimibacter sp.]